MNDPPSSFDELFDPDEPFDATQFALHGLLSIYFENALDRSPQRAQSILDRAAREAGYKRPDLPEPSLPSLPLRRGRRRLMKEPEGGWGFRFITTLHSHASRNRRAYVLGSLVVAACLLLIFRPLGAPIGVAPAAASDLREIGFAPSPPLAGFWIDPADRQAILETEGAIVRLRTERDQALAGLRADLDPWIPWTQLYRRLRSLGRIDESLREMHAFRQYAEERNRGPERFTMYYSCLTDLGNTYHAIGDYDQALHYYQDALRIARDYVEWFHHTGRSDDARPHAFEAALANTLTPCLWSLSTLSAAQGNQKAAWDYHRQAGELLLKFFQIECRHRGLSVSPDAPLPVLCKAVAGIGATGVESHVVKVREHLLREARLHRLNRDLDSATLALENGKTLPDFPFADESRLDFNEPMEDLRIAIACGNWPASLAAADEAERHAGPREFPVTGHLPKPPIGVLAQAELTFLHGVARAGVKPADPEALRLIESAIGVVNQSGTSLPESQREQFLARFQRWIELAEFLRQSPQNQLTNVDEQFKAGLLASLSETTREE